MYDLLIKCNGKKFCQVFQFFFINFFKARKFFCYLKSNIRNSVNRKKDDHELVFMCTLQICSETFKNLNIKQYLKKKRR